MYVASRMTARPPQTQSSPLARPVATLLGVGPERASQLERLGIRTISDLLLHAPRRYEDRQHLRTIASLERGEPAIVRGKVIALGVKWFKHHTKSVCEVILDDGTARLHCRWWNLPFMDKYFARGDEVLAFGRPVELKPRTIDHPETEVLEGGEENFIHLNRLTPIYALTEGLPQRWLRSLMWRTVQAFGAQIPDPWPLALLQSSENSGPANSKPPSNSAEKGKSSAPASNRTPNPLATLPSRAEAIRMIHFPEADQQPPLARRRLALDEFIELQLEVQTRRRKLQTKARARPCAGDNRLIRPFLARLGFKLTEAQTRVLRELRKDMGGPHPMRRLLQGDVGSGKTVVAACCALMSLESGFNVALMAPTEILAEQHYRTFTGWLEPLGIELGLRTGSWKTEARGQRPEVRNQRSETRGQKSESAGPRSEGIVGRPCIYIGTHALIQPGFEPENLGLVIIDEQHKFGVVQREELVRKGAYPHLLVMTATPIPRTLGLTVYGDLDVSVLDQSPPGRGQIRTFVRPADKLPQVWEFIRSRLAAGEQAYVVYPRVEDTGSDSVKAVVREYENVQAKLAPYSVGLLHGRQRAAEKEAVMKRFRTRALQVLLTTSLIEVGLDVPNATVMLIENAEQFGLAQLHQLRGRIGRGGAASYCILVAAARNPVARQRLQILEQSTDGFQIAEADLKLRGPGELLGAQQSGIPEFRFGDLARDLALIEQARGIATALLDGRQAPSASPALTA